MTNAADVGMPCYQYLTTIRISVFDVQQMELHPLTSAQAWHIENWYFHLLCLFEGNPFYHKDFVKHVFFKKKRVMFKICFENFVKPLWDNWRHPGVSQKASLCNGFGELGNFGD